MAINRAPWAALVDDDNDPGTPLVGSIWNKAAIKDVLLDPIDAMGLTYISTTTTGTIPVWTPGTLGQDTVIDWRGASNLTIDGLAGGVLGMRLTIINRSGSLSLISIAYQGAGAAAGQKFFNHASSAPTIIGLLGSATWVYDGTAWTIVSHVQGTWTGATHTSSAIGGGTFTGVTGYSRWALIGRSMNWSFDLTGTIAGTVTQAAISIPGGYSFATLAGGTGYGMAAYAQQVKANAIQYNAKDARFYSDVLGGTAFPAGAARFLGTVNFEVA